MGHFRSPDVQGKGVDGSGCPNVPDPTVSWSVAATDFRSALDDAHVEAGVPTVLLGTGDNFAPELEAREFCEVPAQGRNDERNGKEFFTWDGNQWVVNTVDIQQSAVRRNIPFDNVANFFVKEGYAALVPGKHDFYFGPERLRELANYLATTPIPLGLKLHLENVQMLGANIAVQTAWKTEHKTVLDTEDKIWFIPRLPTVSDLLELEDPPSTDQEKLARGNLLGTELKLSGLSDGGSVYPWFQGADLQISGSDPDGLVAGRIADDALTVKVCPSSVTGNPDSIMDPNSPDGQAHCKPVTRYRDPQGDGSKFRLILPNADGSVLIPGENYGLCFSLPVSANKKIVYDRNKTRTFCVRFSVRKSFFQRTWPPPNDPDPNAEPAAKEPKPYVLLQTTDLSGTPIAIAIFGVVDPHLGEYIGMLNLAWENQKGKKYKTQVAMTDPEEALKEMLDYFEAQNPCLKSTLDPEEKAKCVVVPKLTRVLLAQMSPAEAQALARRTGKFQVVISAADPEAGASNHLEQTETSPGGGTFSTTLAVPEPYYVAGRTGEQKSQWMADIGSLQIYPVNQASGTRKTVLEHFESVSINRPRVSPPNQFWVEVQKYLNKNCLESPPHGFNKRVFEIPVTSSTASQEAQIEWLAACVAQKQWGADVVLFQKRDFFVDLPYSTEMQADTFQQFLGRLIWKGDFLSMLYVPGSALQAAMKQSKAYDADDASTLSLADEKKRGLVATGIRYDSAHDEYVINEVPLDKNRIYAVVTSDYIGAGDTGYPDLATSAIRTLTVPKDFDSKLIKVSGAVCRDVGRDTAQQANGKKCIGETKRDEYFDGSREEPANTKLVETALRRFWEWSIFRPDKDVPGVSDRKEVPSLSERIDQSIQWRRLGAFHINQPSGTLFTLDNSLTVKLTNHKFTDGAVGQVFAGNPTPQLSAKASHEIGYDIQPTFSYSWHRYQIFAASEERYDVTYTGKANAPRVVNQKQNLLSLDPGLAIDFKDRSYWHVEAVESFHYETQLRSPTLDTLAPEPSNITIVQPVDKSRTHYLLPRTGVRFVNRMSWIEAGLEDGTQLNTTRLIPVSSAPTNTKFQLLRKDIPASGSYWRWHLVVPFSKTVKWTVDEQGDFFFNQHGDSTTDTRFRSDTKSELDFQVFPSLLFAPTYEFYYYANKVRQDWYWQGQASIQMKLRFDFWNTYRVMDQLKYKIPSQ
jgi:hypothetical protein